MESPMSLEPTREDLLKRLNDFRQHLKSCTRRSPCSRSLWHGFDISDRPEWYMEEKRMHKQAILARRLKKINQRRLADGYNPCKAAYASEEKSGKEDVVGQLGRNGRSGRKGGGDAKKKPVVKEKLVMEKQNRVIKLSNVKLIQEDCVGTLETHVNGFQFTADDSRFHLHCLFKDIKAPFFALAEEEDAPPLFLIHLANDNKVTKRKTKDLIFHLLMTTDSEKQQKLEDRDTDVKNFVFNVENKWMSSEAFSGLGPIQEFDGMFNFRALFEGRLANLELTFFSMVVAVGQPSIDETFFVVNREDIEIVNFCDHYNPDSEFESEIYPYEMVVVCMDFKVESMLKIQISSESISHVLSWLHRGSVKYYWGKKVENWKSLVDGIAKDFQTFLECGGWEKFGLEGEYTKEAYYSMESESDYSSDTIWGEDSSESDSEEEKN